MTRPRRARSAGGNWVLRRIGGIEMTALRLVMALALAAVLIGAKGPGARAQTIKNFEGHFVGKAVTHVNRSRSLNTIRNRDLDVTIKAAAGGGFTIEWTTTISRYRWFKAKRRKRTNTVTFVPTGKAGQWRAATSGDPLTGKPLMWARVAEKTLYIYVVALGDDGGLVTATYKRTLSGPNMFLMFRSTRDGRGALLVTGWLSRAKQ